METTTNSFLPIDIPRINALRCYANCNKEGEPFTLKMCPHCRFAHYCDDDCQKVHRQIHKPQCIKHEQNLKQFLDNMQENINDDVDGDNDNDDDDELFKPIPPKEDCPICTHPLPINIEENVYMPCCGNVLCDSCVKENIRVTKERGKKLKPPCPFCRAPYPSSEENIILLKKQMDMNDSEAIYIASVFYMYGMMGLPQDSKKTFELWLRAAELGHSMASYNAALYYEKDVVVPKDMTKAKQYYVKAAKQGSIDSRYNLGVDEWNNNNEHSASRHLLISAAAGDTDSLNMISKCYRYQLVTKEEYVTVLTAYSNVHENEWSSARDAARTITG